MEQLPQNLPRNQKHPIDNACKILMCGDGGASKSALALCFIGRDLTRNTIIQPFMINIILFNFDINLALIWHMIFQCHTSTWANFQQLSTEINIVLFIAPIHMKFKFVMLQNIYLQPRPYCMINYFWSFLFYLTFWVFLTPAIYDNP